MREHEADVERIRAGVNCAVLLERHPPPWQLDRKESTRRCLKYRRGAGEILLVTHEGRGWWDPLSTAKGNVIDLLQYLAPTLNFGQICDVPPVVYRRQSVVSGAHEDLEAARAVAPGADEMGPSKSSRAWHTRLALPHRNPPTARSCRDSGK